jgi:hypothetical protein
VQEEEELVSKGLAQVIKCKRGSLIKMNFDNYAQNVEAILINPKWNTTNKDVKEDEITLDQFKHLKFSHNLLIDGLVLVWIEKEILSKVIEILEKQDLTYVENVCWVMIDETKRKCMIYIFK